MQDEIDDRILSRYLSGAASEEERITVDSWIAADPGREEYVRRLKRFWHAAGEIPQQWDVGPFWQKAVRELDLKPRETVSSNGAPVTRAPDRGRAPNRRLLSPLLRYALPVLLVSMMAGLYLLITQTGRGEQTYFAEKGAREQIQLADGTHLHLNAGSRLIVSASFGQTRRAVQLSGEAFFDVAVDPQAPFIIETHRGRIEVLGTSFSVSAYPEEETRIAVVEGRVAVRPDHGAPSDTVVLRARDLLILSDTGVHLENQPADFDRHLAWREGQLAFRQAAFEEVVRSLERWYDLDIDLAVPERTVNPLTASFTQEPVDEVLEIISAVLNLKYERHQRSVRFFR